MINLFFPEIKLILATLSLLLLFSCKEHPEKKRTSFSTTDKLEVLHPLPRGIDESSGIFLDDNLIWTHNDSGDRPFLYAFTQGDRKLKRKVFISGAKAKDWEAITTDDQFVYIGDIGNNNGRRRDLTIYRVPLDSLRTGQKKVALAGKIQFEYADQTTFKHKGGEHNFDCEAMIALSDSLYLFTKNWANEKTTVYKLPKKNGNHIARPIASFNVEGLVTAASYDNTSEQLYLLGYTLDHGIFEPFIWLFDDFPERKWFQGSRQRFDFTVDLQMEAIVVKDSTEALITCERGAGSPGELFRLSLEEF